MQGTILEAALESAIDTDLPGAIRAVLTVDVLSYDGTSVLLPRGTRLIGTYSSKVKIAQSRALVAWNRAITPAGTSVELGGIGGDELGRSGQTGDVDTHFWEALRLGRADLADRGRLAGGDRRRPMRMSPRPLTISPMISRAAPRACSASTSASAHHPCRAGARISVFVNRDCIPLAEYSLYAEFDAMPTDEDRRTIQR